MMKVAFLDRDGTINKDYDDNDWKHINNPEILDGNIEGLKKLKYYGYEIIIITNQYIISDGIISEQQYEDFNRKLIESLKNEGIDILKIYYCPHNDLANCNCKKPKTGMIDNALNDFDIDLAKSFYIGDDYNDYELAKKFGLDFYGIEIVHSNIEHTRLNAQFNNISNVDLQ